MRGVRNRRPWPSRPQRRRWLPDVIETNLRRPDAANPPPVDLLQILMGEGE